MVRFYLINSVKPKDFRESVIDELRIAYLGDNELFEALLQEWMKQHLNYLRWYAQASSDPLFPLTPAENSQLVEKPVLNLHLMRSFRAHLPPCSYTRQCS